MLENSFCQIRGISLATERALWSAGITCWHGVPTGTEPPLSSARWRLVQRGIHESLAALTAGNLPHFTSSLPRSERWRLIPHLGHTAYLDIETSGLGIDDHITTIALYDGTTVRTYVHDINLNQFAHDITQFDSIVTFNGSCFDLPVLRKKLHIDFPQTHIDLRFIFASLGIKGGLKAIEKRFSVGRDSLDGVDGYTAVLLWERYKREKCSRSLETLLSYNVEDVLSLSQLVCIAFNHHSRKVPIQQLIAELPLVRPAKNPHRADPAVLTLVLKDQYGEFPAAI